MRTSGAGADRSCGATWVRLLGAGPGLEPSDSGLFVPIQKDAPAISRRAAVPHPTRSIAPRFTGVAFFGAGSSVSQGRRSTPLAVRLSLISTHLLGRGDAHQAQSATDDLRDS